MEIHNVSGESSFCSIVFRNLLPSARGLGRVFGQIEISYLFKEKESNSWLDYFFSHFVHSVLARGFASQILYLTSFTSQSTRMNLFRKIFKTKSSCPKYNSQQLISTSVCGIFFLVKNFMHQTQNSHKNMWITNEKNITRELCFFFKKRKLELCFWYHASPPFKKWVHFSVLIFRREEKK